MKKTIMISLAVIFLAGACSDGAKQSEEQTQQKPMTNREKAQRAGKFGDRTLTHNLEKQLTGMVDSADAHQKELEAAAGE